MSLNQTETAEETAEFRPRLRLELLGRNPERGQYFCATCCFLYMGRVNTDENAIAQARATVAAAERSGKTVAMYKLPDYPDMILRFPVTVAPSVYFPDTPMPVCWVHIQGSQAIGNRTGIPTSPSPIIPAHSWKGT